VKNGKATPFLQIRDNMGANRLLKTKTKKKKKGDMRQCQTGKKGRTSHITHVLKASYYTTR